MKLCFGLCEFAPKSRDWKWGLYLPKQAWTNMKNVNYSIWWFQSIWTIPVGASQNWRETTFIAEITIFQVGDVSLTHLWWHNKRTYDSLLPKYVWIETFDRTQTNKKLKKWFLSKIIQNKHIISFNPPKDTNWQNQTNHQIFHCFHISQTNSDSPRIFGCHIFRGNPLASLPPFSNNAFPDFNAFRDGNATRHLRTHLQQKTP